MFLHNFDIIEYRTIVFHTVPYAILYFLNLDS